MAGRPKLDEFEVRSERITFRLTCDEKLQVEQLAKSRGQKISDFLREVYSIGIEVMNNGRIK